MTKIYSISDYEYAIGEVHRKRIPFNKLEAYLQKNDPYAQVTTENRNIYFTGYEGKNQVTVTFASIDVVEKGHSRERHEEITTHVTIIPPNYKPQEPPEED